MGWQSQVHTIRKKVFAGIGAVKGIRSLVPRQTLMRMYEALVTPYFDYCFEVWGCMGKGLCDRLQRLQNRAGRIITFSDYNTRSATRGGSIKTWNPKSGNGIRETEMETEYRIKYQ